MTADAPVLPGDGDPPPVERHNPSGAAPCLVVCDHASRAIPRALGGLGLAPDHRDEHIAWDIGAAAVARRLARRLDAPALLCGYSRLVIDANRHPGSAGSIVEVSDSVAVPGNRALSPAARAARLDAVFRPYHEAIEGALDRFAERVLTPALVSVHTMTPCLRGRAPRWQEAALCWYRDDRMARPVLERLRGRGLRVGDNTPFRLDPGEDYTVPEHALRRGLPHLQLELRQDLVADEAAALTWADRLHDIVADLIADPRLRRVRHFRPRP